MWAFWQNVVEERTGRAWWWKGDDTRRGMLSQVAGGKPSGFFSWQAFPPATPHTRTYTHSGRNASTRTICLYLYSTEQSEQHKKRARKMQPGSPGTSQKPPPSTKAQLKAPDSQPGRSFPSSKKKKKKINTTSYIYIFNLQKKNNNNKIKHPPSPLLKRKSCVLFFLTGGGRVLSTPLFLRFFNADIFVAYVFMRIFV
jgi:hypothetical protein